ncbi:pectinesterase 1-like [Salvia miltiorrhiza]|uniref:pectinesterase 1-like n=1 Tax=Salvia miltiorrhiza TaxID=226208 RepID=UPI0025ABE38C|nr:pectinesterase 1-like [Salvia miltiorrhiza]
MKMSYIVVKTLLLFILNFLPIIACSKFIIPADKSELESWFDAALSDASAASSAPKVIKVRAQGGGDFKTVTDAINSIPAGNKERVVVSIGPGNYTEKISIPSDKPFITLQGDPNNMPFLVFNGTAAKYGTVDSATLTAEADNFYGVNLNVVNSSPRPDGMRKGAQALALRIGGDASAFYNCKFYGYQDTVFDYKGRHLFKDCYIEGTVDFIFGSGQSIYMNSEIHVIPGDPVAFITAHARSNDSETSAFVFVHCSITGTGQTAFLGRSWFPYARVVYANSNLTDVVNPLGWSNNMDPKNNRTVYFGEFKNEGAGSNLEKRVTFAKKLTEEEAKPFITLDFIGASSWLIPPPKL